MKALRPPPNQAGSAAQSPLPVRSLPVQTTGLLPCFYPGPPPHPCPLPDLHRGKEHPTSWSLVGCWPGHMDVILPEKVNFLKQMFLSLSLSGHWSSFHTVQQTVVLPTCAERLFSSVACCAPWPFPESAAPRVPQRLWVWKGGGSENACAGANNRTRTSWRGQTSRAEEAVDRFPVRSYCAMLQPTNIYVVLGRVGGFDLQVQETGLILDSGCMKRLVRFHFFLSFQTSLNRDER